MITLYDWTFLNTTNSFTFSGWNTSYENGYLKLISTNNDANMYTGISLKGTKLQYIEIVYKNLSQYNACQIYYSGSNHTFSENYVHHFQLSTMDSDFRTKTIFCKDIHGWVGDESINKIRFDLCNGSTGVNLIIKSIKIKTISTLENSLNVKHNNQWYPFIPMVKKNLDWVVPEKIYIKNNNLWELFVNYNRLTFYKQYFGKFGNCQVGNFCLMQMGALDSSSSTLWCLSSNETNNIMIGDTIEITYKYARTNFTSTSTDGLAKAYFYFKGSNGDENINIQHSVDYTTVTHVVGKNNPNASFNMYASGKFLYDTHLECVRVKINNKVIFG